MEHTSHLVSAFKKFPWVNSIGASGARSNIRSDHADIYTFLFLRQLGHLQHWTDTGYHTTREQGQHQEQLAGIWEKGAWMTHYHVSGL
jgi:hypothetical protein